MSKESALYGLVEAALERSLTDNEKTQIARILFLFEKIAPGEHDDMRSRQIAALVAYILELELV